MNQQSSLEKILSYKGLKPFLLKEEWLELGRQFNIDSEEVKQRMRGKIIEDAFLLIAYSYEGVDAILAFNEAISKLSGTPSPDGLIIFKNGSKYLFEVKAKTQNEWQISKARLESQKNLANKLGIELIFVLNLAGYWGIYSIEYIEGNNYKIEHPKDLKHSIFDRLFEPLIVKVPKGLQIVKEFSKVNNPECSFNGFATEHGYLTDYCLIYEGRFARCTLGNHVTALTSIELRLNSMGSEKIETGELIKVTHECKSDLLIYDYNFTLDPIHITQSDTTKDYFDISSFISHALDSHKEGKLNLAAAKNYSIDLINDLESLSIPLHVFKASEVEDREYI